MKMWRKISGRKKVSLFLLLFFFLTGCERQDSPASTSPQLPQPEKIYDGTIIALGDSLTAGWQVINAGISGETSSGALARINWIIAQQPDIVILETGANDGMRGIPTGLIRENISRAVGLLKEAGVEVVLAGMQMLQNLGPVYTKQFAAVYPEVAEEQEVILIPFFLEQVAGNPSLNLEDFIHPTPALRQKADNKS
jgi:acyl-CoA thioesterase-1